MIFSHNICNSVSSLDYPYSLYLQPTVLISFYTTQDNIQNTPKGGGGDFHAFPILLTNI